MQGIKQHLTDNLLSGMCWYSLTSHGKGIGTTESPFGGFLILNIHREVCKRKKRPEYIPAVSLFCCLIVFLLEDPMKAF